MLDRVRHSLRVVMRHKRFSVLAILSLAVAIALNTTMYSVLDALIFPKIAMREPNGLYSFDFLGDYKGRIPVQEKLETFRSLTSFEDGAGGTPNFGEPNVVELHDRAYNVNVLNVTSNYFALLGNRPSGGRLLSAADEHGEPRPVVISERLWKQLFPELTKFPNKTILLDGEPRSVIGVLPYEADFPGSYTDIWQLPASKSPWFIWRAFSLVRLKHGVTPQQAAVELAMIADRFAKRAGENPKEVTIRLWPVLRRPFKAQRFHVALIASVLAVLLVACVNLSNLQLARGISRARELATRAAVGASRGNIIAQLVLESAWLALAGLGLGLLLTLWGMYIVAASVPHSLDAFIVRPQASWRLFAVSGGVALLCLALIGLVPAIQSSRVDINELLKSGAGTGRSRRSRQQYGSLVVIQVSLALALLVGAILLLRTALSLYQLDIPEHMNRIMHAYMTMGGPDGRRRMSDISAAVVSRVRALPSVENAATSQGRMPRTHALSIADPGGAPREIETGVFAYNIVSSEYLRTLGLKVYKGRDFQEGEFAQPLVIVDDRTARYLWPGIDPIGKQIKLDRDASHAPWLTVIGVSRYFNYWSPISRANQEERLAPSLGSIMVLGGADTTTRGTFEAMFLFVRARHVEDVQRLPLQLKPAVHDAATGIRLGYPRSWRASVGLEALQQKQDFIAALFTTFAIIAMAVAALGVYAIVSHSVSQRTREFGVRVACGASARDILQSVLHEGNVLALTGIAFGLIIAAQTVGLLQGFLGSEEDRYDSWLYAIVALLLFAVSLFASYVPARRAMRINPVEALRSE